MFPPSGRFGCLIIAVTRRHQTRGCQYPSRFLSPCLDVDGTIVDSGPVVMGAFQRPDFDLPPLRPSPPRLRVLPVAFSRPAFRCQLATWCWVPAQVAWITDYAMLQLLRKPHEGRSPNGHVEAGPGGPGVMKCLGLTPDVFDDRQ